MSICLILHGYSSNKEQLFEDVKYYYQMGLKNIVLSSYSPFLSCKLKKYCKMIDNSSQKFGSQKAISPVIQTGNEELTLRYDNKDYITDLSCNSGLFAHITTSRRGIETALKFFPNCKYYMKLRCDMRIKDIGSLINNWRKLDIDIENDIFKRKLITKDLGVKDRNWYMFDYWLFGLKEDIVNYYSFRSVVHKNKLIKDGKINTFGGETMMCSSYILNTIDDIEWEEAKEKYFYLESESRARWWKADNRAVYPKWV